MYKSKAYLAATIVAASCLLALSPMTSLAQIGDIRSDGVVDDTDIISLQKYMLGAESFTQEQFDAADLNDDASVNGFDLAILKRIYSKGIDYGTQPDLEADMIADLRKGTNRYFFPSGPWANGGVFDCGWTSSNIKLVNGSPMEITITDDPSGKYNYLSGEYRTYINYHYGYYECSMMPIKANGVDTGFFTYTGPSEGDPWDEIDFEFLGYDTTKVQLNYFSDGEGGHEYMLDLGFDASKGFHTYGFLWLEDSITWYVDGEPRYAVTETIPCNPSKIMVNAWPGINCDEWLKPFEGNVPLTAKYQWITWSSPETFLESHPMPPVESLTREALSEQ